MQIDGPDDNNSTIARSRQSPERRMEPLSEEWFKDLDQSIDEITRLFEELSVAPPEPKEAAHIREAEHDLDAIQDNLMDCLTTLEGAKLHLRQCSSPNDPADDPHRAFQPRTLDLQAPGGSRRRWPPAGHEKSLSFVNSSLGDAVMKQIFKWWQPRGPGDSPRRCDRLGRKRGTEVDGWLIH